jgi:hypothetical protein
MRALRGACLTIEEKKVKSSRQTVFRRIVWAEKKKTTSAVAANTEFLRQFLSFPPSRAASPAIPIPKSAA